MTKTTTLAQADQLTTERVNGMSTTELLAAYNRLSGKPAIKAFHTRAKGVAQVLALIVKVPATKAPLREKGGASANVFSAIAKMAEASNKGAAQQATKAINKANAAAKGTVHTTAKGTTQATYAPTATITLLAASNPKRGASAARFAFYKSGQTVAQYIAAGGQRADLAWDVARGYITIAG